MTHTNKAVDNIDKQLNRIRLWWAVENILNEKGRKLLGRISVHLLISVIKLIGFGKALLNPMAASVPLSLQRTRNRERDRYLEKPLFYKHHFYKELSTLYEIKVDSFYVGEYVVAIDTCVKTVHRERNIKSL